MKRRLKRGEVNGWILKDRRIGGDACWVSAP